MYADDDGIVNCPKKVMRIIGANDGDMKVLIEKRFVYWFDEKGLAVIKHWWLHNVLKSDRYKPTEYIEEKALLKLKDNKVYTLETEWNQIGTNVEPSTDRNINKYKVIENNTNKHYYGQYKNVLLSDKDLEKLKSEFPDWEERIEVCSEYCASKGKKYSNYLATIRNWARKDKKEVQKDVLPVYNAENNKKMDADEEEELLKLMGRK